MQDWPLNVEHCYYIREDFYASFFVDFPKGTPLWAWPLSGKLILHKNWGWLGNPCKLGSRTSQLVSQYYYYHQCWRQLIYLLTYMPKLKRTRALHGR